MRVSGVYVFLACLCLDVSATFAASNDNNDSSIAPHRGAIATPRMAVDRAFQYTGFPELQGIGANALSEHPQVVTITEDETPFLRDSVVGRRVWRIRISDVRLDLSLWTELAVAGQTPKSYEIWIDSATGVMYKIFSDPVTDDPDLAPEPPSDTATATMRAMSELYLSFPPNPPKVSFLEALNNAAGSNPLEAKEIIAWCVMWSHLGKPPGPTWQIIGRGIPPFEIHPRPHLPMYLRNRQRSTVDATTGVLICVSNSPPVLRREGD